MLCIDIGGTSLRAALWDGQSLSERRECATPQPATPEHVTGALLDLVQGLPLAGLRGVGVATSGVVVQQKLAGHTFSHVTSINRQNFPEWDQVPLAELLQAVLGVPCVVLNDARSAAWGEYQRGAGQGADEFMFITVSTGVGAGVVLRGELHLARNGLDTELGWLQVPTQLHPHAQPQMEAAQGVHLPALAPLRLSALELESSGNALERWAEQLGYADARSLCDAAEAGDAQAEAAYGRSAALIAWKIADCAALMGIERVALGGSVGLRAGYLARVQQALLQFPALFRPTVVHAQLGADAGLVGVGGWAERCLAAQLPPK